MAYRKRHVIIFLPDGRHEQWTTSKDMHEGDTTHIHLADTIECEPHEVRVAYKEDDGAVGKAYAGMPYILEMW